MAPASSSPSAGDRLCKVDTALQQQRLNHKEVASTIGSANAARVAADILSPMIARRGSQDLDVNSPQSTVAGYNLAKSQIRSAVSGSQSALF